MPLRDYQCSGGEVHIHFPGPVNSPNEIEGAIVAAIEKAQRRGQM